MQLRRFTADSTPAALGAVRLALGDDAIILANRKIGNQVEIIATGQMDDAESLAEISLDSVSDFNNQKQGAGRVTEAAQSSTESSGVFNGSESARSTTIEELTAAIDAVDRNSEPLQLGTSRAPINGFVESPSTSVNDVSSTENSISREAITSDSASGLPKHPALSAEQRKVTQSTSNVPDARNVHQQQIHELTQGLNDTVDKHIASLVKIIEAQSTMINQHFKGLEVNMWGNSAPNRRQHLQRLLSLGIGAELAVKLVERSDPESSVDDALRQSFALLKSTLPIGADKTFAVPGITIISGAPGAGKTTALMKLATQHVKDHGSESIVIICADTRRIGAFEELQSYGRLLGVPTVHAHDSSELESLLSAFTHKQLVLVDHTLPQDEDAIVIPRRFYRSDVPDSFRQLLVISATSQSATVDALIERHCTGMPMQCILSNLDANARLGEIFNAVIRHHLPVAYWSDSASVQKPLQKADASVLIATAVEMSKRLPITPDEEWMLRLIQPSDQIMENPVFTRATSEVKAC